MTPKQKAQELISNHKMQCRECGGIEAAKIHSIITVNEIMNETSLGLLLIEWWNEVKKQIELI